MIALFGNNNGLRVKNKRGHINNDFDAHRRIPAFTVFEVTVVIAIMSVLITIISASLNRFNEQLKISQDISEEMNEWRMIRSTLWKDCYLADSMDFENGIISCYNGLNHIEYKSMDDQLYRARNANWEKLNMAVEDLRVESKDSVNYTYCIDFKWKGEPMYWRYHFASGIDQRINNYFNQL